MNRNRKLKKHMMSGIAVGMAAIVGASPVYAASGTGNGVSKEETVYVNAGADGSEEEITVSNWLKNAGAEKTLKDESQLSEVKNVKGDEAFTQKGSSITWQTEGEDIYYQGKTEKELPVSVKFTYYLDGKESKPEELAGKSGELKIRVEYTNHASVPVQVGEEQKTMYSPFVMVTGLILPDDTFSNVKIDNGKVISDGSKSIVVGIGMPGLKESLGLEEKEGSLDLTIPESLEITADVENFSMGSTFTVALADMLDGVDTDQISGVDDLQEALNDLEDAALQLVDGSQALSDGVTTLYDSYGALDSGAAALADGTRTLNSGAGELLKGVNSYTSGADELNQGIQTYLGKNGVLTGSVKEYVNGVEQASDGVKQYVGGTGQLLDGVNAYVAGEQQLAEGAEQLRPLVKGLKEVNAAIGQLDTALNSQDVKTILAGAKELSKGTAQLKSAMEELQEKELPQLMELVNTMLAKSDALLTQAQGLCDTLQKNVLGPVKEMESTSADLAAQMQQLGGDLYSINGKVKEAAEQTAEQAAQKANERMDAASGEASTKAQSAAAAAAAQSAAAAESSANAQLQSAKDSLLAAADASEDPAVQAALREAAANLGGIAVTAPSVSVQPVSAPHMGASEILTEAKEIDITGAVKDLNAMKAGLGGLNTTFQQLLPALQQVEGMQSQLNEILAMKEQAEGALAGKSEELQLLNGSLTRLDSGMASLDQGMTALVGGLTQGADQLYGSTKETFPAASDGILALLGGFDQLSANNKALMEGAAKLQKSSPALLQGTETLKDGTLQLSSGLNQLSGQLSNGAGQLSANSSALRSGAATLASGAGQLSNGAATLASGSSQVKSGIGELKNGAEELRDGMKKFEEEGTGKLKSTAEDEFLDLLDRIRALNSEECSYTTYSGKAAEMEGSVKFIIETAAIQEK